MKTVLFIISLIALLPSLAQEVYISGRVVDESGTPVAEAIVTVKGVTEVLTGSSGRFNVPVIPGRSYRIKIKLNHNPVVRDVDVEDSDVKLGDILITEKTFDPVIIKRRNPTNIDRLPKVDYTRIASGTGNFEDLIKLTMIGVSSSNELSANYNVRGGNYDENLIYVNGIQIYRPFLVRTGQQEGLSFINSSMVEDIYFSAGGFDSYYGDKLSSVLDVTYREPRRFAGSLQASFMGGQLHLEGRSPNKRASFLMGARYRANSYLLNSLPTKGDYNPVFFDYQVLSEYYLNFETPNRYKKLFFLGHYSNNNYIFVPKTRLTSWGTVNEAYQLRVYYDGQQRSQFATMTGALGIEIKQNSRLSMSIVTSAFHSNEAVNYDILGQYWINQLETDPSKEDYGDSTSNVGVGGFLNHARNDLEVLIANTYFRGKFDFKRKEKGENQNKVRFGEFQWGGRAQLESFHDRISEWSMIDSAGYSIPQGDPNTIELQNVIKQNNDVQTFRLTEYMQFTKNYIRKKDKAVNLHRTVRTDSGKVKLFNNDTIHESPGILALTVGQRFGYRDYNQEYWFTPRMNISYTPRSYFLRSDSTVVRRTMKLRFSSGLYYQPPLYRMMRGINGVINPSVVSQKSFHNVLGMDVYFNMWGREFKFVAETYYKYMWDVVPYEVDNVLIRYFGENSAVAYAYGADAKINGQFVPGVESFFRIGYLKTAENISNDDYYIYLNSSGDTIIPGYTFNNVKTDSILQSPGYIPRPSDQRLTFAVFFQDHMPRFENLKLSANFLFCSPLPYGPPTHERYKDVLRTSSYIRVDLGIMYDFINKSNKEKYKNKKFLKEFEQVTLSLDAFNLLGIKNTISYSWLQDIAGRYYAIPNHLTGRRINLRLVVKF